MGKRRIARIAVWSVLFIALWMSAGCGSDEGERRKVDYTVVKSEDYPDEVREIIEEQGQKSFRISWSYRDERYLLIGYGIQSSGGCSIQVEYLEETEEHLYVGTKLLGPGDQNLSQDVISCPCLVIKIAERDKKVVFS